MHYTPNTVFWVSIVVHTWHCEGGRKNSENSKQDCATDEFQASLS